MLKYLAGLLGAYSLALVAIAGPWGFSGDAWWVFSFGYYYRPLNAIYAGAENLHRPMEVVYWISLYELFGPQEIIFQLGSLMLAAVAAWLMASTLSLAFPQQKLWAGLAGLMAFFLPSVAGTTYLMQMDNGRLQMAFFWAGALTWVWCLKTGRALWWGLLPFGFCILGNLSYESGVLLPLTLPLLAWGMGTENRWPRRQWMGVSVLGIGLCMGVFLLFRFVIFQGGAVEQRSWIPPLSNYADYTTQMLDGLWAVWQLPYRDAASLLLSLGLGLGAGLILWPRGEEPGLIPARQDRAWLLMALAVFYFGALPYFLAGGDNYLQGGGFVGPNRVYSSGGYGAAMLIIWVLMRGGWKPGLGLCLALISLSALYHSGQHRDYQAAAVERQSQLGQVLALVPEVQPKTTLLLLNFHQSPVISGETGTNLFFRMLYDDPSIWAHFAYLEDEAFRDSEFRRMEVGPEGILARGRQGNPPAQPDELLILYLRAGQVWLLECIGPQDLVDGYPLAAAWQVETPLCSQPGRILPATPASQAHQRPFLGMGD
jgi:hypothetical protein